MNTYANALAANNNDRNKNEIEKNISESTVVNDNLRPDIHNK